MKWDTPARSSRSSREPAPIQNPIATERTLGTRSEMTRSPESSSDRTYFCTPRWYATALRHELQPGAGPLGLVQRFVREPEQRLRVVGVAGARGDAEARPHAAGHLVADAVDHLARVVLGRLREEQRELVAADAEGVVSLAQ